MKTEAKIIADSVNPAGVRLTTFILTYQRYLHGEIMTHRAFSRNAASSRAIPIEKFMEQVEKNPAMPTRWGLNGKGMQDHGIASEDQKEYAIQYWKSAAYDAIHYAGLLAHVGIHKQIVNRILEPWQWMTTIVSATEWENFFSLRVHKDAHPDLQHLAYLMLEQYVEGAPPKPLQWSEWHIPFGENMPTHKEDLSTKVEACDQPVIVPITDKDRIKIAVARIARVSYNNIEGKNDPNTDFALHDRLVASGHMTPLEHVAKAFYIPADTTRLIDSGMRFTSNFHPTWAQYRQAFPNQNRKCDLKQLLSDYRREIGVGQCSCCGAYAGKPHTDECIARGEPHPIEPDTSFPNERVTAPADKRAPLSEPTVVDYATYAFAEGEERAELDRREKAGEITIGTPSESGSVEDQNQAST